MRAYAHTVPSLRFRANYKWGAIRMNSLFERSKLARILQLLDDVRRVNIAEPSTRSGPAPVVTGDFAQRRCGR